MTFVIPPEPTEAFPYRIERLAGTGAMGVVYRAVEPLLDRPVAIKILKTDEGQGSESRARFLQEARAAAVLAHPGVTTVYRVGELQGAPYLVMEWLEGRTLEEVLEESGPLSLDRSLALTFELLDVLAAAHQAGVVHRDLKPSNLVVLDNGRLKVMDFGIALLQGKKLVETMVGTVLATPQYASPEQLQGSPVDGRSDLFSTAVLLYHMLTGALPFEGRQLGDLLAAIINRDPVPLTHRRTDLSPKLEAVLNRALAKSPADRFPDAARMSASLKAAVTQPATGTATSTGQSDTTRLIPPPLNIVTVPLDGSSWTAVREVVATWPSQSLGVQPLETCLNKLLDTPFHTPPFAGAADFGDFTLMVSQGILSAVVDRRSGEPTNDPDLPDEAPLTLHAAPVDEVAVVPVLASMLLPCEAEGESLDTDLVQLPGFLGRQLDRRWTGRVELVGDGERAQLLFADSGLGCAVMSPAWAEEARSDWAGWTLQARGSVLRRKAPLAPPPLWFRHAYGETVFRVHKKETEVTIDKNTASIKTTGALERLIDTAAHRSGARFFQLQRESGPADAPGAPVDTAPAYRALHWLFDLLPVELLERRKAGAWKYLADWLPLVHRARLYTSLPRPNETLKDPFTFVTEDEGGKILHVADRYPVVDVSILRAFVDKVLAAKEARLASGDIGGAVLFTGRLLPEVAEAYKELLHRGLGNKLFGIDKSMGYDGFVRMSARRGFHLLLVEEDDAVLRPRFDF